MTLNIDPELKAIIRPLSESEYIGLEKNLLKDGCRDPIIVWNDTIVDGHNRYEICYRNNISFKTFEQNFSDKEEAKIWIMQNQLARRNLTKEEFTYLIGKIYESEKKSMGGNKTQNTTDEPKDIPEVQNEPLTETLEVVESTAEKIATRYNISESTVKRANEYSKAVDILEENVVDAKKKLLSGKMDMSKKDIITLAQTSPDNQKETIHKSIKQDNIKPQKEEPPREKRSIVDKILDTIDHMNTEDFLKFEDGYTKMKERKKIESTYRSEPSCPETSSTASQTQQEERGTC